MWTSFTSLTKYWQKAGAIHSLACIPQSIQIAFFFASLFTPIWTADDYSFQTYFLFCFFLWDVSLKVKGICYLKQANSSLLIGLSIFNDGHNIWVSLGNLSHPVADLQNRTPLHVTVTLHLHVRLDLLMLMPFSPLPLCCTWSTHDWCCYKCKNTQRHLLIKVNIYHKFTILFLSLRHTTYIYDF